MTAKPAKIAYMIITIIIALMLIMSAVFKLSGNEMIVKKLSQAGLGLYIKIIGAFELIFALLLLYPKTSKIGFFFLLSYLGGAASIELASGQPPTALVFIALLWVAKYLKDKPAFLPSVEK